MLLVGCSKDAPEPETAVPVQVTTVQKTTIRHTVTAEAILFPLQQSALVPKISAPVQKFYVNRGSKVHKGQLLAVLENRDLAAAAQDNKGAYEQAEAAYATTTAADLPQELQKAQLDFNAAKTALEAEQKVYDSRKELFQQGALPRKELDQAAVDLTNARNTFDIAQRHLESMQAIGKQQTLKSASGQLQSAKGKLQGAEAQLSYSEIRSPMDGVITDRPLFAGEMAAAGTPLLTVMDISQIVARAHIPESEALSLKVGDAATIIVAGLDDPVPGKVTVVSPALDPNSTTLEVWVQANNPDQTLKPGLNAQVSIVAQTVPDALVIPSVALLTSPSGQNSVMVVGSDSHAHQQTVKTGIRQGDQVQIVGGLGAGQQIVTEGAYGLPNNAKITVQSGENAQPEESEKPSAEKKGKDDGK